MAVTCMENWLVQPTSTEPIEAIHDAVSWELDEKDKEAGMKEFQMRMTAIVTIPYSRYAETDSVREFYANCVRHIGELHAALVADPDGRMESFRDVIVTLAQAMYEIDHLTSVEGEGMITAAMPATERNRVVKLLDEDRERFCQFLSQSILALKPWPDACAMYTEFAHIIFIMNNYQPPARTVHDAHKMKMDGCGEIDHFMELLQHMETMADSASEKKEKETTDAEEADESTGGGDDDATQTQNHGDNPKDKAEDDCSEPAPQPFMPKTMVHTFECEKCDTEFSCEVGAGTALPACPQCYGSQKDGHTGD